MRLRAGEALAAAGGLVLLVVLFLGWYETDGVALSAWEAFAVTDVLLALVALLALGLALAQVTQRAPALPVGLGVLTAAMAIVVGLLLVYRLLDEPGPDDLVEVNPAAWLGLLALALTGAGAWRSIGDEGPVSTDPLATPAERRPAPPPA
jgi:multisubunit Na+/H+ antiporter MnhB subunit